MSNIPKQQLAAIQYIGVARVTAPCKRSVMDLVQSGKAVRFVKILTHTQKTTTSHALLLGIDEIDQIAVKTGFTSGYTGEGPSGFSFVLKLFEAYKFEVEEYEVGNDMLTRLDNSALTIDDLSEINKMDPIRPIRWDDYVIRKDIWAPVTEEIEWNRFAPLMPLSILDARIADLAIHFWSNPDDKIFTAWRQLEDLLRKRLGSTEHSAKLFAQAFQGESAKLEWAGLDNGEAIGRGQLFTSAYLAHRNPRAHKNLQESPQEQLREFLLINHLYCLEASATPRKVSKKPRSKNTTDT